MPGSQIEPLCATESVLQEHQTFGHSVIPQSTSCILICRILRILRPHQAQVKFDKPTPSSCLHIDHNEHHPHNP